MKLLIDSSTNYLYLSIVNNNEIKSFVRSGKNDHSETLVDFLNNFLKSIWAKTTALKIKIQPICIFGKRVSCKIITPPINANTDSKLIISEATVGSVYFWPTICNVNAIQPENTAAYKIAGIALYISLNTTFSVNNIKIVESIPATINCIADNLMESIWGFTWSTRTICNANITAQIRVNISPNSTLKSSLIEIK